MSTAVILAGGLSTRMGYDKQLLEIDNELLMVQLTHELKKTFKQIFIISNHDIAYVEKLPANVSVYQDEIRDCGPLGGIHTALKRSTDDYIYVMACDMPHIDQSFIDLLKKACDGHVDAVVAQFGEWIEPFHAMYNKSLVEDIEKYLLKGRRSIYGLLKDQEVAYIEESITRTISPDWSLFDNINTKEDLMKQKTI